GRVLRIRGDRLAVGRDGEIAIEVVDLLRGAGAQRVRLRVAERQRRHPDDQDQNQDGDHAHAPILRLRAACARLCRLRTIAPLQLEIEVHGWITLRPTARPSTATRTNLCTKSLGSGAPTSSRKTTKSSGFSIRSPASSFCSSASP